MYALTTSRDEAPRLPSEPLAAVGREEAAAGRRLAALRRYGILDTPPEPAFERIVQLARRTLGTPVALINLLDDRRGWFKACHGLASSEVPLDQAFCAHTVRRPGVFIIPDTAQDPRFSAHPLVTGAPKVRFYAGAPLVTEDGVALGALCVLDTAPRAGLTAEEQATLQDLAAMVIDELELRRVARELERQAVRTEAVLESITEAFYALDPQGRFTYLNAQAERFLKRSRSELLGRHIWSEFPEARTLLEPSYTRAAASGRSSTTEVFYSPLGEWFEVHAYPSEEGLSVFFQPITERRRSAAQLAFQASLLEQVQSAVIATDAGGRVVYWNRFAEALYGWTALQMMGQPLALRLIPNEARAAARAAAFEAERSGQWSGEINLRRKDGGDFPSLLTLSALRGAEGELLGFVGVTLDITERRQAELHESDRRRILEMVVQNRPLEETLGKLAELVERQHPGARCTVHVVREGRLYPLVGPHVTQAETHGLAIGPEEGACGAAAFTGHPVVSVDTRTDPRWARHQDVAEAFGLRSVWSLPIVSGQNEVLGTLALYYDNVTHPTPEALELLDDKAKLAAVATEHQRLLEQLSYSARHDALTGLLNRRALEERLSDALVRSAALQQPLAVLFLDLDRFKRVNDTLGHAAGDELLQLATERLRACVGHAALARVGGDEFLCLLEAPAAAPSAAPPSFQRTVAETAQCILRAFEAPFQLGTREVYLGITVGVSTYPEDGADAASLIRDADTAMYQGKVAGKNTVVFFTSALSDEMQRQARLEHDLRLALSRDEFRLLYQPQVDLQTGELTGVEALVRWQHPEFGPISPSDFIPVAEEGGLIIPLGAWILRQACRQGRRWQLERGGAPLRVAVNVSALQFGHADFVDVVTGALAESGLAPEALTFEITESVVISDLGAVVKRIGELKALGVRLSLDDFGTGYSSLAYLRHLPIDEVKIDKAFLPLLGGPDVGATAQVGAADGAEDRAMVQAIVSLAHALELTVIAEGVEEPAQAAFLRETGCDEAQGYLFSRPLGASDVPV